MAQPKYFGDGDSTAEVPGDGQVQPGRIYVGQIVEAERRLVTEDTSWPVASVPRPEPPEDQVRALGFGEAGQLIDSAVFAKPIADADVIDPFVAQESECDGSRFALAKADRVRSAARAAIWGLT